MFDIEHIIFAIDTAAINGGAAKVAIDEAKALVASGRRVTYFAPCGPVDEGLAKSGVEVVCLHQRDILDETDRITAMRRGLWNGEAARALAKIVADADPKRSILHGHSFSRALSPAFGPVFTSGKVPHVYTMHEYFLACPNGGFFDYQHQEICRRRALGASCLLTNCDARRPVHKAFRVARQALLWSAGRLPRGLRDVIYISRTQLNAMRAYLPKTARLHYLSNPVAVDLAAPRIRAEDNDIFLYVGRLSPEKGCVDFALAAKVAGVRAVFLGTGPEEAAIRVVNPEADLIGWISPAEVAVWMSKARALVFPSLWYEGQPLVSMESLSKGLPVIVAQWNAAVEQIENNKTGLIYSHRKELATVLTKMSTELARELSCNAYLQRQSYGLSVNDHIAALIEIYRKAAEVRK